MKTVTNTHNTNIGTAMVILAGSCWGFISIFIRRLSSAGFSSLEIVGIRAWFSVAFLLLYMLFTSPSQLKICLKDIWMFIGTGVLSMTFFTYCYFTSIVNVGAAVSVVLLYTSPVFVMLMSAAVFHEQITGRKVIALILTFSGCLLTAGLIGSGTALSFPALLTGLGAGFGYALYSVFAGFAVRKYSPLTITFYTLLFCGISMLFLIDLPAFAGLFFSSFSIEWPYMVGIALICTAVPYVAYTLGLGRMDAGRAAVLVTVEPLVGTLLGILAYHEDIDLLKLIGIILIFAAVILQSTEKTNEA